MAGKIKEFQKKIADDADFKETIMGSCALAWVRVHLLPLPERDVRA